MNIFQEIKGLWALRSAYQQLKEAYMLGNHSWLSTRFWLTATSTVATFWAAVHGFIPQPYSTYILVSGVGLYTIVETIRKIVSDIQAAKAASVTVATTEPVTTVTTPV